MFASGENAVAVLENAAFAPLRICGLSAEQTTGALGLDGIYAVG
jgi:hypothetical protein